MQCAYLYLPPIRVGMRDTCINYPDVEFTVIKILFYEILIMLRIKFITKTNFFLQVSDANLEFITRPIPTFGTIRFLDFSICTANYSYSVLNQAVPRISLIKFSLTSEHLHYFVTFFIWGISMLMCP